MASQVNFAQLWYLTPFISPNYNPKTVNELKAIADMQRRETIGHIYLEVKTICLRMSEISYLFWALSYL